MTRQDDHEGGSKAQVPAAAVDAASQSDRTPLAPFEPPVRDPGVLALLKGLNPSVTPLPTQVQTTDGEMSAKFSGGPRALPQGGEMPSPEALVVVNPDAAGEKKKAPPDPGSLESTFRNRPRKVSPMVPVAIALVAAVGVGVWMLTRAPGSGSVETSPSAGVPSQPVAPVASVAAVVAQTVPVVAASSVSVPAAPPSATAVSASKGGGKPAKRGDLDPSLF